MMADDAKTLVRHHTTHHFQQFGVVWRRTCFFLIFMVGTTRPLTS